jgi:hypothetical protein
MTSPLLSLSLLNGQLKAVAFARGSVKAEWECSEPVTDLNGLDEKMEVILRETQYAGGPVSLVLAHPRLTQQLIETPPVKGWSLQSFLERRVKQFKGFTTDAAWSYQHTLPTKNAQAVLLHLTSRPFLDQLTQICAGNGLRLTAVMPASVVLSRQLSQLPVSDDDVVLLAAETGTGTTVVVGRRDGRIYLGRSLSSGWKTSPEKIQTDLNRTILYTKQQFGTAVNSVWLLGNDAGTQTAALQTALGIPVRINPVVPGPFHWNHEAAELPSSTPGNLITSELQQAPRRRVLARVTAVMIAILALVSVMAAASVEWIARDRQDQIDKLEAKLWELEERKVALELRETEVQRQQDFIRIVSEEKVPAVGGWLLGHLGDVMPSDLLLTGLDLRRENDLWKVQLDGALQPGVGPDSRLLAAASVDALTLQLAEGPFHLELRQKAAEARVETGTRRTTPASRRAPGWTQADEVEKILFSLEGAMR